MKQTLHRAAERKKALRLPDGRQLPLSRPLVMGILNVTPDSFSDGGRFLDASSALRQAGQMVAEGADIIDIGGESTRPGAEPISVQEELDRTIETVRSVSQNLDVALSIDTQRAEVAREAIRAGAMIVNDVSALRFDSDMPAVVRDEKVPVVLMHMLGKPRDMQANPHYTDCVAEIGDFFEERVTFAVQQGIDRSQIIIDPGIGFGKRLSDNLEILARFSDFQRFDLPVLIGASRKSFINMLHPSDDAADQRIGGSISAALLAALGGAVIFRVHDVLPTVEALKVFQAVHEVTSDVS